MGIGYGDLKMSLPVMMRSVVIRHFKRKNRMTDSQITKQSGKRFNWRGLTSFLVTVGFLVLIISGAVLYAAPQGRVAQWTDWRFAGLCKDQWSAIHMVSCVLFIVTGALHLCYNWPVFLHYIKSKAGLNLKREMAVAAGLFMLLIMGVLWEAPPFRYVVDVNDRIKAYWDERSETAPYPHAEDSTVEEFARRTGVPLEDLLSSLSRLGVAGVDASITITDASRRIGMSPSTLFRKLKLSSATNASSRQSERRGGGTGLGLKTLKEVCDAQGIDLADAVESLRAAGILSSGGESLRDIAERAQRPPAGILALIRGGKEM